MLVDDDVVDERRLDGEDALNTDVVTDFANGEAFLVAFAIDLDDNATVLLNTFLVTFNNFVSYTDGVAKACSAILIKSILKS